MSRTDHHAPWRLWDHYGLTFHDNVKLWRCQPHKSVVAGDVRLANRRVRRKAREELRRGMEPAPYRNRHDVRYHAT
jgi:hypothetical protein